MSTSSLPSVVDAGITIPGSLVGSLISLTKVAPNDWNPNRMETFMREKLRNAIKKDGFIVPVIVRSINASSRPDKNELVANGVSYEIIDGEHRWREAQDLGMREIPIVDVGMMPDAQAKQVTIKANALRGDFDSVKLAEMIAELSSGVGVTELLESLPYTAERIQAMLDLSMVDTSQISFAGLSDEKQPEKTEEPESPDEKPSEFREFKAEDMQFKHKCPRCNFQFNESKTASASKETEAV